MIKKCLLQIVLIFVPFFTFGQVYDFQSLTQEDGLPSSTINAIFQDSRDYIWIGTEGGGLVRYDGLNFESFNKNNGFKTDFVTDIIEDSNKNLIISSNFNGIYVFNGNTYFKNINTKTSINKDGKFAKLLKTTSGIIAISDFEIILIKPDYTFSVIANFANGNEILNVNSIVEISKNKYLVGTQSGVFEISNNTTSRFMETTFNSRCVVTKDIKNSVYIATDKAQIYHYLNNTLSKPVIITTEKGILFPIKNIFIAKSGNIWMSSNDVDGICLRTRNVNTFFDSSNGFEGNNINCFFQDSSKTLYIGTYGKGIYKTASQQFIGFKNVTHLNHSEIFSVIEYKDKLYTSIKNKEVFEYKISSNKKLSFIKKLPIYGVYASIINHKNQLVFGTSSGVSILDNEILYSQNLIKKLNNKTLDIKNIFQDKSNNYYLSTSGNGLLILDENFKIIAQFNDQTTFKLSNYVYSVIEKNNDSWYVSTNRGLFILKKQNNTYSLSKLKIYDSFFIATKDNFGNFWFAGTKKLYAINKENKLLSYDQKSGLLSLIFYTLITNNQGDLLVGSNLGLAKIKVNKNAKILQIENFNSKNGFSGLETNMRAQYKNQNGDVYLGTVKGIYQCLGRYKPDKSVKPIIKITEIKLFNEKANWKQKKSDNKWENIPNQNHEFKNIENQLTFKYLTINNSYTKSASYSFKLDGLEKSEWSLPSQLNEITFSNLGFGKYTFRVKLVDNLNNPLSDEVSYSFYIDKPFYLNWWFIMTFMIILYVIISIIFTKSSSYNKNFIKNYSENETSREQYRLYLLFLGITIPLIELIVEITGIRGRNTIEFNLIVGLFLISIYLLSKKFDYINRYLPEIFTVLFILYGASSIYRVVKYPDNISSGIEFIILFYLSFSILKSIRIYWLFIFTIFGIILALYTANYISKGYCVVLFNYCVLISILNHVKYISNLNSKDKFLFADNIVNKGTTLVLSVNLKGEVVFCSETITEILGYTPEEVKGYNYWVLTEDSEFKNENYTLNDSLYVRKLKCKDGSYKFIQWKDSKYSNTINVGIGQDVTEQIEVQHQYKKLIENATDIIFEIDKTGKFTFINNFTQKLLGFTSEEILGKYFTEFIMPNYAKNIEDFYKNINLNIPEIPYVEFPVFKKDRTVLWLSQKVTISRNAKGEFIGFSAIARDITQLKNIEVEQKNRQEKTKSYNDTINILVNKRYTLQESIIDIINGILKTVSENSKINKVGFWEYTPTRIECLSAYSSLTKSYQSGKVCTIEQYPKYFEEFNTNKIVLASDVFENKELYNLNFEDYKKSNIKSILDLPVILNGEIIAVLKFQTSTTKINWDNDDVSFARSVSDIVSLAIEARKRLETEDKLKTKTEILSVIAVASEKLLKSKSIDNILNETFELIGKASKIDRICYFESNRNNKTLSQKNEWVSDGIRAEIDNQELQNVPYSNAEYYLSKSENNKVFKAIVKDIEDENLRLELEKYKILSILNFPIFVKSEFYGFIGFDDCTTERDWSDEEIGVLQILANNIATAIERIENEKLLQESEERFRLLANNIPGTVYLSENDENWTKIYINDEIKNLTGYDKELFLTNEVILINLIHPDDYQRSINQSSKAIKSNKPFRLNYRIKHKEGHYVWVEEFGDTILKNGKVAYIEGILIDDTQKREIESEIKARELAEASNKAKSEFLANMSHEIRTPLNAIIGFSNLMKETNLNKDQNQYITTVNQSASILLEVVNNILDFSKIETGKLELDNQSNNIREIANQVIDIVRFDSEQKNIELNLYIDDKIPPFVTIDALRIKQVLLNLLTNAIKFTNKGKVDLNLHFAEINNNIVKLRFEVQDSGIGIKKDNIKKIFEPFSQEDNSTTRKYGGTGLGLSISNNILALMNSKLELSSNYNKGSLFYFELALKYNHFDPQIDQISKNINAIYVDFEEVSTDKNKKILTQSKKILIIEDNKINMLLARTLVKKILPNAIIYEALNGKLGLEKFLEVTPDIILLDIQMPIFNGYETAQKIRQFNTQVPIIALTAGTIKGEKEKCIEVGMNDYISKPIIKEAFENMLEKWLK